MKLHHYPKRLATACLLVLLILAFCSVSFADQRCSSPNGVSTDRSLINMPAGGGNSSFGVTAVPTCTWNAQSNLLFVHITSITNPSGGPGGIGSGIVNFSADPNPDLAPRGDSNFAIKVTPQDGGPAFVGIVQAAACCDFTLAPDPPSLIIQQGASGSVTIRITRSGTFTGAIHFLPPSGLPSGVTANLPDSTSDTTLTIHTSTTSPGGDFPITITGQNGSVSHTITVHLLLPDFSISPIPPLTITQGTTISSQVTINSINAFSGTVGLGPSNVPSGVAITFNPNPTSPGSTTMAINANGFGVLGAFNVPITGTSQNGNLVHATNLQLTVAGFTVSSCGRLAVAPGGQGPCSIAINAVNGYSGAATLTLTGLPAGANASFSPNTITASSSGTLTVTVGASVPPGTYPLTITGTDGNGVSKTTTVNLIVEPPPAPSQFVAMTPCRVVDTRNPNGPFGGPFLTGGATREFDLPNSTCGIPSTALSYVLNITVVPKGPLGFLTMGPCGQNPPSTSNLNSADGRVKAVEAIVPAGTNGGVCVTPSNDTDVVLDISGYFVPAGTVGALQFYPLPPCRVADTRSAPGPLGGPSLSGGLVRTFPIRASSCSVPMAAQAYSLNFTAVPNGPLGYLTAWPAGQPQPGVSTLNAPTGTTTANAAIVTAGTNGDISAFVSNNSDLVIDINGYFAPPGPGGLSLFALTPCRVLDTRIPPGAPPINGTLVVNVVGSGCGAPASAQAYVLNATVIPSTTLGYLTLWPDGTSQPVVSTLNAGDGAVTSNLAIVPTSNGSVDAFASNPTHLVLDIFGYFAP